MSGFRLQTFSPFAEPVVPEPVPAEPAPPSITPEDLEAARAEAYATGFLAGHAAATEAHLADQARLTADVVEALNDAQVTNDAARRHVMASVAPMIKVLCDAIAPALARAGLGLEVAARVERAVAAAPAAVPRLRCAAETVPALQAALAARDLPGCVEADPRLLPREVELHWDEGFDRVDLDACVAEIRACIASHVDPVLQADEGE